VPHCRQCATLRAQNTALRRENQRLREQIARLREWLSQARRAAKRQAAPFSKGPPQLDPRRPGRKAGIGYGVKARRPIPRQLDEIYEVKLPERCPHCDGDEIEATGTAWQYQEEIPEVKPLVRGFQVRLGRCVRCRRAVRGRHPLQTSTALGAAGVHLGPHALALAADLNKRIGVPFDKLRQLFLAAFALAITPGGLSQALGRVAKVLAPTYHALVASVRRAPLAAADETGWKVGGHLQWLWVFVTETVTVYAILDGRGYPQACAVLGPNFAGILLRDGWSPYRLFEHATHQTCVGGHLLRRCRLNLEDRRARRGAPAARHPARLAARPASA
jgi:transposase